MNRIKYITELDLVGHPPRETSGMDNTKLHALYVEERERIEEKQAELESVIKTEKNNGRALKEKIAYAQKQRQLGDEYAEWSANHLPKSIVFRRADIVGESMPQNPNVEFVSAELRAARTELRRAEREVIRIGGEERISKVKQARMKVQVWEAQMQEVTQ